VCGTAGRCLEIDACEHDRSDPEPGRCYIQIGACTPRAVTFHNGRHMPNYLWSPSVAAPAPLVSVCLYLFVSVLPPAPLRRHKLMEANGGPH
jgi:hypothetical protein